MSSNETAYYAPEALHRFACEALVAQGASLDHAEIVAEGLIEANLRGVDSHGVMRLAIYCERVRRGLVNTAPDMWVEQITPAVACVDGDNGFGFVAGKRAMEAAIHAAEGLGIGMAGVRHSTHFGMAALYVKQAMRAGLIGLALTNSSPAIPVWGGRSRFLGTAPLAAGVPGGKKGNYLLDMAMSVVARGKVRLRARTGEPIPEGWALDSEGRPTTDAQAGFDGVLLPFGGMKGSGLAMLIDILGGVMTGSAYGGDAKPAFGDFSGPQDVGHMFIAMRPDLFVSRKAFAQRMDTLVDRVKAQPLAEGFDEILMPGEPEERTKAQRRKTGIPLAPAVADELAGEAEKSGLTMPEPL